MLAVSNVNGLFVGSFSVANRMFNQWINVLFHKVRFSQGISFKNESLLPALSLVCFTIEPYVVLFFIESHFPFKYFSYVCCNIESITISKLYSSFLLSLLASSLM